MDMLTKASSGPTVVACNTCRRAGVPGGGALLVAALREAQVAEPAYAAVAVEEMPCLFACAAGCTVHLRAPGKIGYVLGHFEPDADAARAILDYAMAYAASAVGQVPYRTWPEGVKGHFLVRTPPEGFVVT
jgi:predicted metal-binding protein